MMPQDPKPQREAGAEIIEVDVVVDDEARNAG
jgi:hypothetical protein